MADLRQDKANQTAIEVWYDVLKKVMKMWETSSSAKTTTAAGFTIKQKSDADDFYVFMYDEEDKQAFK